MSQIHAAAPLLEPLRLGPQQLRVAALQAVDHQPRVAFDHCALIRRLRALPAHAAYARFEDRAKALIAGFTMHVPNGSCPRSSR